MLIRVIPSIIIVLVEIISMIAAKSVSKNERSVAPGIRPTWTRPPALGTCSGTLPPFCVAPPPCFGSCDIPNSRIRKFAYTVRFLFVVWVSGVSMVITVGRAASLLAGLISPLIRGAGVSGKVVFFSLRFVRENRIRFIYLLVFFGMTRVDIRVKFFCQCYEGLY